MPSSPFEIEEATIDGVHAAMRAGEVTARGLVEHTSAESGRTTVSVPR